MKGHRAHRAADAAISQAMRSCGYGEGVDLFEAAVHGWHRDGAKYPRPAKFSLRCLFGRHRWVGDEPTEYGWDFLRGSTCARCGRRDNPGNPCP
jgi:hypothetical protein